MRTADPGQLAAYRTELISAGLPPDLADQVVLSAADAAHRETTAAVVATPPLADDDSWSPTEATSLIEQGRARRAAELAEAAG